ncbi:MAG: rhomboid family intramembrane serine protease [Candidatus Koribacter versatilis]|uniref:Rhomboid family intramembrane serine protease n=1 Tax=Candidatus Korobacter versatilis TaxID=658062 RepID=A0A932EPQ2_9BACT|nr:rhomboid family intramembrane serine protease [Candidatus Koribacter versatilis]
MAPYRAQAAAIPSYEPQAPAVTVTLLALNIAYFMVMVLNGVSPSEPQGAQILRWGSDFGPLTLGPEPWRLVTCMFVHIGFIHLLVNMWSLWVLGSVGERLFGRSAFLLLYLSAGVTGEYLSLLWSPVRNSAGASGAIFGIAGALLVGFKFGNLGLHPAVVKQTLRSLALVVFYNLAFGLFGNLNNMAHLGGLAGGVAIGYAFTRFFPAGSQRYERAFLGVLAVVLVALVGGYFGLRQLKAAQLGYGQAQLALEHDDCKTALAPLERSVAADPKDAAAHQALAYCYEQTARGEEAVREFERAVALEPRDNFSWNHLGWAYLERKQLERSEAAFRSALRQDARDANSQRGLGYALLTKGDPDGALAEMKAAVENAPEDTNNLKGLASVQYQKKLYADEVKTLQRLLQLAPDDAAAHAHLADAYEKLGDTAGAARERDAAKKLTAGQPQAAPP